MPLFRMRGRLNEPLLPPTAYAVLGLLTVCGPASGYDLKAFADRSIRHFYWSPAKSQVYTELRRLERHGLAKAQEIEQRARPHKRVYKVTRAGREALRTWLDGPDGEPEVIKSPLLLKVMLGASADPATLVEKLKRYNAGARAALEAYQDLYAQLHSRRASAPQTFYSALTVESGIAHLKAGIEWSAKAARAIEKYAAASQQAGKKRVAEKLVEKI
jgi:DNA-binding PadR family transcriptional regulator